MSIKRIDALKVSGKRVFCRVDFNVPLAAGGKVTDSTRIQAALPTLRHLLQAGAKPILASHLGRPKGKVVQELRMEPVGAELARLLGPEHRVLVAQEVVGDGVKKLIADMQPGDVVLLENVRFEPGETKNDEALSKAFAALADVYVNDAFGTAHRAHASTVGVVSFVQEKAAGFLMMQEVEMLSRLLGDVDRPFVALLGGAKVSDKIGVLENLLGRVNALLIGGAMANTFVKASGGAVGASLVEEDSLEVARRIVTRAKEKNVELLLPVDVVVADSLDATATSVVAADAVPEGKMALDIGPQTRARYAELLSGAKTLFWNGPMGVFEKAPFAEGTMSMARAVTSSSAFSVVGGGDSVAAIKQSGLASKVSHISTGGGASLEFVEGKQLPGILALQS